MLVLVNIASNDKIPIKDITFVIGRESILQCTDKKISRNHGVINILDPDSLINVKATHVNPIFYKCKSNDMQLQTLRKDEDTTLSVGDMFGLLETEFWYELATGDDPEADEPVQNSENNETSTHSEPNTSAAQINVRSIANINATVSETPTVDIVPVEVSSPTRRLPCWMVTQNAAESSTSPSTNKRVNADEPTGESSTKRTRVEEDNEASTSGSNNPAAPIIPKTEPIDVKPTVGPADSSSPARSSCNFGIRCYRRSNPSHAAMEAHPGDPDYRRPNLPPAPSTAPACPFAASCYRRNPRHFMEFSHPDSSIYVPANLQQQILINKRHRATVNYDQARNVYGSCMDDDDEPQDFSDSDEDPDFDPNKTDTEQNDDDDATENDTEPVV